MMESKENNYIVIENQNFYLILEAVVQNSNRTHLQGFISRDIKISGIPFPLLFDKEMESNELLEESLRDGWNHIKSIENFSDSEQNFSKVNLQEFTVPSKTHFFDFVLQNAKSEKLIMDIKNYQKT